jgi:glycosyltransferase involved in cell wall biosynthesis
MCTKNRASALGECLRALHGLKSKQSYELILIDNGSSDDTPEILKKFANEAVTAVKLVFEPRPGVCRGRNAGIKVACGELIVFIDDDCYPTENFLQSIEQCFQDPSIGFLGGKVLLFDPADLPITIQTLNHVVNLPPYSYIKPGLIHGANFSFRKDVLDQIGGFDTHLGPGTACRAADDTDLMQRASVAGFAGQYNPSPTVFHHHRRQTPEEELKILQAYAISRGAYFMKGLLDSRTRHLFYWPVIKRLGGHILYFRINDFTQELNGAKTYWQSRQES